MESRIELRGKASAHGAVGHWIYSTWWTHKAISLSNQCSTTDVTKIVVCVILSLGFILIKDPLLLTGFVSHYLGGPLPMSSNHKWVQCIIK